GRKNGSRPIWSIFVDRIVAVRHEKVAGAIKRQPQRTGRTHVGSKGGSPPIGRKFEDSVATGVCHQKVAGSIECQPVSRVQSLSKFAWRAARGDLINRRKA